MGGRAKPDHDGTHRGDTEHTTPTMTAATMTTPEHDGCEHDNRSRDDR